MARLVALAPGATAADEVGIDELGLFAVGVEPPVRLQLAQSRLHSAQLRLQW
jgi:hypothetical protein